MSPEFKVALRKFLRRRATRAALVMLASAAFGYLCRMLPEALQSPCHVANKVVELLFGIG